LSAGANLATAGANLTSVRAASFGIVFAVVYAVAYFFAVEQNWALVTYHPQIAEFGFGVEKPREGPAMYWFGWLVTAGIIAGIAGVLAALLPDRATRFLRPTLTWVVPLCAMLAFGWLLRAYFLR
jgi:hypothetical protein